MNLVSVIMPCYNDGAYIKESIESVRRQIYPSIELIIIDDGSDDLQTIQTIKEVEKEGFAKVLHLSHTGPSAARNAGIQASKGEYIFNLDSDDIIEPEFIAEAVKIMDASSSVGIVYCKGVCFGEYNGPWNLPEYSEEAILVDNMIPVAALYRKEDWEKVGGYKTTMKYGMEDYDFWLSIIELEREVVRIPKVYFHYRVKTSSVTSRLLKDVKGRKESYSMIYSQHPLLFEKHRDNYIRRLRNTLLDKEYELSYVQNKYYEILNSTSWRIAKVFCRIMDVIKLSLPYRVAKFFHKYGVIATAKKTGRFICMKMKMVSFACFSKNKATTIQSDNEKRELSNFLDECENNGKVYGREIFNSYAVGQKRVLLFVPDLNRTDEQIALLKLVVHLKDLGFAPVMIGPNSDNIESDISNYDMLVIAYNDIYTANFIPKVAHLFSMVVVNTVVGAPLIQLLDGMDTPVMWWIHEENFSDNLDALSAMPEKVGNNIHIYCTDISEKTSLLRYRPEYNLEILSCNQLDDRDYVVAKESNSLSKLPICLEKSFSANVPEDKSSRLICHDGNPPQLGHCTIGAVEHSGDMQDIQSTARKSSEESFCQAVNDVLCKVFAEKNEPEVIDTTVSFIIPVLNGGSYLKRLINSIRRQIGIGEIEIIIVDSGSTDGCIEYAEKNGAKVIRVKQSEFSHSYARNLGAQNANGDYLIFMTQDACLNGPYWVREMMRPILNQGVVAVSCNESALPGCDLLGRMILYTHSKYMGLLAGNRILGMPDMVSADSLRKNAQLNDIACLICKDVFSSYQYRSDFAEDLELGLRLIRGGYKLALLSSTKVIHSHTRPAIYHFKRGIADIFNLNQILPGIVLNYQSAESTINQILTAYCIVILYLEKALDYQVDREGKTSWKNFKQWTVKQFMLASKSIARMDNQTRENLIWTERPYLSSENQTVMEELLGLLHNDFSFEGQMADMICAYLVNSVDEYFNYVGQEFGNEQKEDICILAEKLTGFFAGNLVGSYYATHENEASTLNDLASKYRQGI